MISVLIAVLIICVVGAICFWAIDQFVKDRRLSNLLKLLVVLICLGAILQRVQSRWPESIRGLACRSHYNLACSISTHRVAI